MSDVDAQMLQLIGAAVTGALLGGGCVALALWDRPPAPARGPATGRAGRPIERDAEAVGEAPSSWPPAAALPRLDERPTIAGVRHIRAGGADAR